MPTPFDSLPTWGQSAVGIFGFLGLVFLNVVKMAVKPLWRSIVAPKSTPLVVRTPEDRFDGLHHLGYNFEVRVSTLILRTVPLWTIPIPCD